MSILRVISGTARGLRLKTPKGMGTRPTTDRVKETLFNIMREEIPEARVLDLFSGTGSLGIECLSRGASFGVFVDKSYECVSIIKDNIKHTNFSEHSNVFCCDFKKAIKKLGEENQKFQIIFLDPPYDCGLLEQSIKAIAESGIWDYNGLMVIERSIKETVSNYIDVFREEVYGTSVISFSRKLS